GAARCDVALDQELADETGLKAASGRIESARYLGYTLGPLLGGALAASGGPDVARLTDAASFAVVAAVAVVLRPRRAPARDRADLGRARDGIVFLLRDRV